ncbi:beta-D-glucosyl crocetin beta-1,6-glucosyltransferase-like [Cucumis melo var. makuwa]|uniref:Beta-D-glucosyl crocetin beta-1,6-glucosyltransferase-like n=1 Tax=Cucumis melo var. makuwa TaxID=1194695 RepID=A0A5D3DDR2_CUCMM|nr:beta-D-glucosyl crocetin beta-1,6-glucosyltransferase-like [Cucumis melo var. makuwa]TYK21706.1 beta-D-glucosyl crocetin beta-1,6-glucosyltransferase-like [Cucumis melo var. makuwa]
MDAHQASDPTTTTILMFPWLGYGHLSAYLELSKALSSRKNFLIYFCSTPVNLDSIKPKLIPSPSIQFVELHLPSSPEFPPHLHTTNALPLHLTPALHQAFAAAAPLFETILKTLSPHLLIYDCFQSWAPRLASSLNIPAINFNTSGTSLISYAFHSVHRPGSKFPISDFVLHNHWNSKYNSTLPEHAHCVKEAFFECLNTSRDVILINSFKEVEGEYMDYLSLLLKKKVIPVGPLVYEPNEKDEEDEDYSRIKNWLDKKEALSTVLASLGSESYASEEEKEEIVKGLVESGANFIWVERINQKEDEEQQIKRRELLEKGGERAMVVKGWAPQGKILKHGSIGGFVSHCGWNSVLESTVSGVPIIGVPLFGDQPFNAGVVEEAGIGVEAKRDPDGKIQRQEVAKLIKEVVVEKSREEIRMRVREMSEIVKRRGDEKIEELLTQISRLSNIS